MICIDQKLCVGCGQCVKDCVTGNLAIGEDQKAHVAGERCILCGHCEAICPKNAVDVKEEGYEGVADFCLEDAKVDAKSLLDAMANRRSVRSFLDKKIEREKIEMIIEAGRMSPTGSNKQLLCFSVLDQKLPAVIDQTVKVIEENIDVLSEQIFRGTLERLVNAHKEGGDRLFFGAPIVIVIADERPGADVDGALAASRMELVANALGLGVCYNGIYMRAANLSGALREASGIDPGCHIVTSLMIGYPAVQYLRPAKRKKAVVSYL